MIYTYSIPYP